MSDRQVAPPAGRRNSEPPGNTAVRRSRWARVGPLLSGRPVRWGFVAVTVGLGGYAVAREWTSVRAALGDLGFATVVAALLSVLAAMVMTMQAWRVLLGGLGSPLPVRAAARIIALLAVGGFAFAWSVGFLVVFAPAGAGIRDVLLVAILGPVLGVGSATAVALVSRALMTAGDLLTAALAAWSSRAPHSRGGNEAPATPPGTVK